ncbi:hypothetical protein A3D00_05195 [Candidatus Woesebacteria bacterium RIFCSPHIGHO2_02_FULL_38_9]|uniref:Polymerase nucleotidyl transferase domain-containing protein n=1 Tax=Candidatus Woesebacteria bacterium RIFCSPHIGHO2_01_FULL_39_28 TaxID=1802496 RepID=A0A1F7Y8X5_9BACT|nr:MAG: hypothetical protein A2627_05265 [Candidatus Woesebacteria bacterium RIFCSPHIGHO2_01_FULL_39_28]OGM34582.1 MAG: hypothetical protein A3D00_05195 [Candidatus Woesebacteria bacterium RIFCSPHIGHO2_02_FULL_38_9]
MNDVVSTAKKFVDAVRHSGVFVSNASIFGSYAKGNATNASDIDVCIVSPQFGKDYIGEMVSLRKIALGFDSRIEPIPLTPKDLKDPYSTLASEIRKYGITI